MIKYKARWHSSFLHIIIITILITIIDIGVFAEQARATEITEVQSANGIKAWLVEDHKLPLISIEFAFRGGVEQDPSDKQGLADMTMSLLTEGAGNFDAAAFQQRLADHSIALSFAPGRDELIGSLKCLSDDHRVAFNMLRLALTKPRFDPSEVQRVRDRQLADLRHQLGDPEWQARYALFQRVFGDHPYGLRHLGSFATLSSISRDDVKDFATHHLAQDNLVVAVAGDITPTELSSALDQIFGELPKSAQLKQISDIVWPDETATILVPREGTQTELLFAMPGPKRDDPDWYAVEIANYILGGGGFSSRLMQDVRDKKGLTYGISTDLSPMKHGGVIMGEAATENAKTGKAWAIVSDTMQHFYTDGVTEEEINSAKEYLIGSLPLALTSTDRIASILIQMQIEDLGRDYLDRRGVLLNAVTEDDVARVIKRWFNPDHLTLSMVGKPDGMTPTITREQIKN